MNHTISSLRRPRIAAALIVVAVLALSACAPSAPPAPASSAAPSAAADEILEPLGLAGADARVVIDTLDALPVAERPADVVASIRPDALQLTGPGGRTASLPMPDDAFYLSIAPYLETTHDCYFHSLTTCRGELSGRDLHVTVSEDETGEIVLDETVRSFDNGFAGLWLPRGITGTLVVELDGMSASSPISTRTAEDATCLTTLQLS